MPLPSVAALLAIGLPGLAAAQTAPAPAAPPSAPAEEITVVGTSPLIGSGIDRDRVPAQTEVLNRADLSRTGTPDLLNALDSEIAGVNLDAAQGNPEQPNLYYHGFEVSPLQGTPQGLAVYVNGIRFNQAFGDTVDWDLIPQIAISRLNLEGANPVFGLNALGGSVNVRLQDGFGFSGTAADLSGGSFGQIRTDFQFGRQSGDTALYVAGSEFHQDGWRDGQSSDVQNLFADYGWKRDGSELHLTMTLANSVLNGPATSPVQLLAVAPAALFTAPNVVANKYASLGLSGSTALSDTLSLQGQAYYGYLLQRIVNGNTGGDAPCNDGSGLLCQAPGVPSTTRGGATIPDYLHGGPYSQLDDQTTNSNSFGASAQLTDSAGLFGHDNQLVAGLTADIAQTEFSATNYLGGLTSPGRDFIGPGYVIDEPGTNVPVRVAIASGYYGLFAADTLSLTRRLTLTVAGRYNAADVGLTDQGGGAVNGHHAFNRFDPSAGLTYKATPWLTAYAGYAEANRAPTPAELSCASPTDTCSLANFFVGDPNLKQVVAHTVEAGLRGAFHLPDGARLQYDLGVFRTDSDDDIAFINSVNLGRAYFANVGQTRRQGFDAELKYRQGPLSAFIAYSYLEATFRTGYVESGGSNPAADANGNLTIRPGDRLPGIPANRLKLGFTWSVTDRWTLGATLHNQGSQYLFGDEANLTPRLPGYTTLDVETSFELTPHITLFGSIENVTDTRYYTYGTFSPTSSVFLAEAPGATNPRAYSPAAPIGGFGGVKIRF